MSKKIPTLPYLVIQVHSARQVSISQQVAGASAGTNYQFRAQEVEAPSDIGGWDACLHVRICVTQISNKTLEVVMR